MSDAVSGQQNGLKCVFGRGCALYPDGGAHRAPPDLLAALRGLYL